MRVAALNGVAMLVLEGSSQGIWRTTVMMRVGKIIFASALVCDGVVARSQGDRDTGADDVVVGNRKDAEVDDRTSRMGIEATCVALRLAFRGPATAAQELPPMSFTGIGFDGDSHVTIRSSLTLVPDLRVSEK